MRKLFTSILTIFTTTLSFSQACPNINFENGNLNNWSVTSGTVQVAGNNLNMLGCCPSPGSVEATIITTPFVEPYAGILPHSPLGGTKVVRLNDSDAVTVHLGQITRITYPIAVMPTTTVLQYAISGYVSGLGHSCTDYAYSNVRVRDGVGNYFYTQHNVPFTGTTSCGNSTAFTNTVVSRNLAYFCWKTYTVNLAPYVGQNIFLEVTAGDCTGWGHAGYCYFDATCTAVTPTVLPCGVSTGIENVSNLVSEVNVWPNPANDVLNVSISAPDNTAEIVIYDVIGNLVKRQQLTRENSILDLKQMSEGAYYYVIKSKDQTIKTGKFIKQ